MYWSQLPFVTRNTMNDCPSSPAFPAVVGRLTHPRLASAVALLAVAAWRWQQARELVVPAWVDSVHHTLLVRILLEQGRLPETWAPYLPEVPLYYHFGFHVTAAVLARVLGWTGLALGQSVLVAGILWQVVAAAGVAALAARTSRSRWSSPVALLVIGFVSVMPAYYVSWGRYTLLAGTALCAWACVALLAHRPVVLGLLVTLTAITHYYALVLLVAFGGLYIVVLGMRREQIRMVVGMGAGLLLASPWLLRTWHWSHAFMRPAREASTGSGSGASAVGIDVLRLLGPARGYVLLCAALAGLVLALRRARRQEGRERAASLTLAGFATGLGVLLGPWQLGPFRPDHAAIVLFLVVVPLATHALLAIRNRWMAAATIVGLMLWGGLQSAHIVDRRLRLATDADMQAITWVDDHCHPSATVLVDVKPWMGIWRGADGGWWITPLTGRRTVLPPVAYGWGPPELAGLVRHHGQRTYALRQLEGPAYCATLDALMMQTGAAYYYTRTDKPRRCSAFRLDYDRDGVRVFTLDDPLLLPHPSSPATTSTP